jgi:hypothetical protein
MTRCGKLQGGSEKHVCAQSVPFHLLLEPRGPFTAAATKKNNNRVFTGFLKRDRWNPPLTLDGWNIGQHRQQSDSRKRHCVLCVARHPALTWPIEL